jgi:hypothetical protein
MMSFAYDRFLPGGMKWRDLFDMVGQDQWARRGDAVIHTCLHVSAAAAFPMA